MASGDANLGCSSKELKEKDNNLGEELKTKWTNLFEKLKVPKGKTLIAMNAIGYTVQNCRLKLPLGDGDDCRLASSGRSIGGDPDPNSYGECPDLAFGHDGTGDSATESHSFPYRYTGGKMCDVEDLVRPRQRGRTEWEDYVPFFTV